MKKNWFKSSSIIWLWGGVMALAILTLAFQNSDGGVDPAHCSTCPPHTPTATPTWTPTPVPSLQACQVTGIFFNDQQYMGTPVTAAIGVPLKVTLRVADAQGAPLIGANVDATVTQINDVQAAAIPPLEDQSGTYDGLYTPPNPGTYVLKFSVSDFTGPRFLPCSAEATVQVELPRCDLPQPFFSPPPYFVGQPIVLTTTVKVGGVDQCEARVSGEVTRSGGTDPVLFAGSCPYIGQYIPSATGDHTFTTFAEDSISPARYQSCQITLPPVTVQPSPLPTCVITNVNFAPDPPEYRIGETINLKADVVVSGTVQSGAVVSATVTRPDNSVDGPLNFNGNGPYTLSYTRTNITGTYTFQNISAVDSNSIPRFQPCGYTPTLTATVTSTPTSTALIKVNPTNLIAPLCSLRETSNVIVENVSNLVAVDLELKYDPAIIQVIDADRSRSGVQVRYDAFTVDVISRNEVDTRRGRIFFKASLLDGRTITGPIALIAIDWRPQRVGRSEVTLERADLTLSPMQTISPTRQNGAVQVNFVTDCRTGMTALQGRSDYSGIIVANETGQQVETDVDGYFAIIAKDHLRLTFPGYLAGQADLLSLDAAQTEGQANNLGQINILAGDVNGDNVINILDMTYLAGRYLSTDSTADLNGDGTVNILDLTLVASNYQRSGPLTTWQ